MSRAIIAKLVFASPWALWERARHASRAFSTGYRSRPSRGPDKVRSVPAPDTIGSEIQGPDPAEILPARSASPADRRPAPADPYRDLRRHLTMAAAVIVFAAAVAGILVAR